MAPGSAIGKHVTMGTHNRLLSLGPRRFLEVIAIDPEAPAPARPRWFELDTPAMRERLARSAALVHWVERSDDLEVATREYLVPVDITPFARGAYRWKMALTRDGSLPAGGAIATLIQWDGAHPADALADAGVRLADLAHEGGKLAATFVTPAGQRTIP